jgi:hypothetical protein
VLFVPLAHLGLLAPPVHCVPVRVEADEMEWELVLHRVLGGNVQHPGDLTQDGLALVFVFVTFDENNSVGLVDGEVDPSKLSRGRVAEMDHGLSIGSITSGTEKFE